MAIAKGDGRYPKLLATLAKTDVLILDVWGLAKLTADYRRDLLEILEDRHGARSTLTTSQLPIEKWHDIIAEHTLADAFLERTAHNVYRINLKGGSMLKRKGKLTSTAQAESQFKNPELLRSDGWRLCPGLGGSLRMQWMANFSGIRTLPQTVHSFG